MTTDAAARGPPGWPIGRVLVLLTLACVIPMLAIGGVLIHRQSRLQADELRKTLEGGAVALSVALDREFAGYRRMLQALAASELLSRNDLRAFHVSAQRAAGENGAVFVSLFSPDGTQVLNTARPFGSPLPQPLLNPLPAATGQGPLVGDSSSLRRVLAAGTPSNSNLFRSLSTGRLLFTVDIPVMREGRLRYVINAAFRPETIGQVLGLDVDLSATPAAIIDGNSLVVSRSRDGAALAGQRSLLLGTSLAGHPPSGFGSSTNREGIALDYAFHRSEQSGWYAVMTRERSVLEAEQQANLRIALVVLAIGVILALGMAFALASGLRRSALRLAAIAAGSAVGAARGWPVIREFAGVEGALAGALKAREERERERERRLIAEVRQQEMARESQRKDVYLATLAHELRNPLAPIRNAVALLRRTGPSEERLDWARDLIDRQAGHMARLLDDLLDMSRIAQGKILLRKARVEVAEMVRDAVETARPVLDHAGHRLAVELPREPLHVEADPMRLAQVISNLLVNAAKYTDAGGEIRLAVRRVGATAEILVADNGIGIDPAHLKSIFEPFAQSSDAVSRAQGGLGIGLALVKGMVELHGGKVTAESAGIGRGACFRVALPLAQGRVGDRGSSPGTDPVRHALSARVLVVDDNRDAADSLAEFLRESGAEVEVCYDGASALARVARRPPDVALVDIGMPVMDGYAVARQLSALARKPVLVALTGWGQEADRAEAAAAGFDRHLTKPVDPEALLVLLMGVARAPAPPQHEPEAGG